MQGDQHPYRDPVSPPTIEFVSPEQTDWDEPGRHVHRAVNIGDVPYEEIIVFFLDRPDDVPQRVVSE